MAAEFLRSHGIDIDEEMARIQSGTTGSSSFSTEPTTSRDIAIIRNVCLPRTELGTQWDVSIANGSISHITQHNPTQPSVDPGSNIVDGKGALLAPSLCHPHVHIDKAYLLSHPKYSHLQIQSGDFKEAMTLTGEAKSQFEEQDLLERGQRVIDESVAAGVTHMRAFVEVDVGVGTKCLDAGIKLKQKAEGDGTCVVQLCAFAQLPLFSDASAAGQQDENGNVVRRLMWQAAAMREVDVVGSTPYVEASREQMQSNVDWMIEMSAQHGKHLDFHLDYHLDSGVEPLIWYVIEKLKEKKWAQITDGKTVVLGHCTRLALFEPEQWQKLRSEIGELPVSFVGLPTSDMFMMRTSGRARGTLNVPELIKEYNLNACLGINNIGNAFTPHGSCDPLTIACSGVGVYQAGTGRDAEMLYECVSTRAKNAIGLGKDGDLALREGAPADLLLFGSEKDEWRTRKSVAEAVYLYGHTRGRQGFLAGVRTSHVS